MLPIVARCISAHRGHSRANRRPGYWAGEGRNRSDSLFGSHRVSRIAHRCENFTGRVLRETLSCTGPPACGIRTQDSLYE